MHGYFAAYTKQCIWNNCTLWTRNWVPTVVTNSSSQPIIIYIFSEMFTFDMQLCCSKCIALKLLSIERVEILSTYDTWYHTSFFCLFRICMKEFPIPWTTAYMHMSDFPDNDIQVKLNGNSCLERDSFFLQRSGHTPKLYWYWYLGTL